MENLIAIGISALAVFVFVIIPTVIHIKRRRDYEIVYEKVTRSVIGVIYEDYGWSSYKRHKKTGNFIEYSYDSQGGSWNGIRQKEQDILTQHVTFKDDKWVLSKTS
jgi:hypothetical protein